MKKLTLALGLVLSTFLILPYANAVDLTEDCRKDFSQVAEEDLAECYNLLNNWLGLAQWRILILQQQVNQANTARTVNTNYLNPQTLQPIQNVNTIDSLRNSGDSVGINPPGY